MIKNEPIIFKIYDNGKNKENRKYYYFRLPYLESRKIDGFDAILDIKINTKWYKKVNPKSFKIRLDFGKIYTILMKPHNDEFFAGWARWFCWGFPFMDLKYVNKLEKYLPAMFRLTEVLFDSDYAYLESETKIGDNFRNGQYMGCAYLKFVPNEDLDGDFDEIGDDFRYAQYLCCYELKKHPKESFPIKNVVKVGKNFQGWKHKNITAMNNLTYKYLKIPTWGCTIPFQVGCLQHLPEELINYEVCKNAVEKDTLEIQYVPKKIMTKEMNEIFEDFKKENIIFTEDFDE